VIRGTSREASLGVRIRGDSKPQRRVKPERRGRRGNPETGRRLQHEEPGMRGNLQTHPQAGRGDDMDRATQKIIISAPGTRVPGVLVDDHQGNSERSSDAWKDGAGASLNLDAKRAGATR
jgi:hypothetical protein